MNEPDDPDVASPSADRPSSAATVGVREFRRIALALGFGVIARALFAFLVVIYAPVLRMLLWAAALAALIYPVHQRVLRLVGYRERLAAFLSTTLTILIFAVPVVLLILNLAAQIQNLWPSVREYLGGETFQRLAVWLDQSGLRPIVTRLFPDAMPPGAEGIENMLRQWVSSFGDFARDQLQEIGRGVPGRLLGASVTTLVYFFFLRHGPGWLKQLERALPLAPEHASNLLKIAGNTINAVFRGVIITAAVQAGLAGIGFAVAGAPAPAVLGAITLIAALIPFVGPIAVWLPVSVGLF